jgi:hypothetical protein
VFAPVVLHFGGASALPVVFLWCSRPLHGQPRGETSSWCLTVCVTAGPVRCRGSVVLLFPGHYLYLSLISLLHRPPPLWAQGVLFTAAAFPVTKGPCSRRDPAEKRNSWL